VLFCAAAGVCLVKFFTKHLTTAVQKKRTTQQSGMQFGWGWLLLHCCCRCVKLHCRQGHISKCRLLPITLVVVVDCFSGFQRSKEHHQQQQANSNNNNNEQWQR
jgi:hypothetical protein